jgi:hypothetical protein
MPHQGWEDWELWISAAERGWRFHRLPGPAFEYRVRPGSMIWQCATPEVGQALQAYIVEKHRSLYMQRLPQLLMKVQAAERLRREIVSEREVLHAERGVLDTERGALQAERGRLLADRERLQGERDLLYQELGFWQERTGFMERTAAWRLRERLIGLKAALRGRRS